ncbi:MAG: class I SAM-dependent methyltransferase, partial [Anaerolineaceae bacterium]|nr:class I SAM-dependent methyltransferase [Anaerolineaceae bacterium]
MTDGEIQEYKLLARHFDVRVLPSLMNDHLPQGPLALADFGCGDGPFFSALHQMGSISPANPVYAVDLHRDRLDRVASRFPFIVTVESPADDVPTIPDATLDFVISTMVLEHISDEAKFLDEIQRVLKPG